MQIAMVMAAAPCLALAAIACLYGIIRLDGESGLRMRRRDALAMAALSLPAAAIPAAMPGMPEAGWRYLQIMLLLLYFMIMAYTDRQTGLVYTAFSLFLLVAELGVMVWGWWKGGAPPLPDGLTAFCLAAFLCGHLMAAKWGVLGMGDVLIFTVLALFYCNVSGEPFPILAINAMLAHSIFFLENLPRYFRRGLRAGNRPFTQAIAFAAFLTIVSFV